MNRSQLRSRTYNHLGQTAAKSNFTSARVDNELNFVYQKVNNLLIWPFLEKSGTITTVASQATYYLPSRCRELYTMRRTDSAHKIDVIDAAQFDREQPDPTDSGTGKPNFAIMYGIDTTRLPAATTDTCASGTTTTSAIGTSASFVSASGTYDDWMLIVTSSGSEGYARVSSYAGAAKTFTLEMAITGLTTASTFYIERRLKAFQLFPAPSSVLTIYLKYLATLKDFSNDFDIPEWGPDADNFHDTIAIFTAAALLGPNSDKTPFLMQQGNEELKKMQKGLFPKAFDKVRAMLSIEEFANSGSTVLPGNYPRTIL